jgi:ribulose-5-phosphate 4-epimerase/fuculose-1-phosphate aldolase
VFTGLHNIRQVDFDGTGPGLDTTHASPNETPIHGEIYRARPQAQAVVHAHPPYALLCGITKLEFLPVFGAFDPSALDIIQKGVPVFPRSVTVTNKALAADMLAAMGDRDVLLMQGHGITVYASSVERATTLAIRFDQTAKIMWELAQSGLKAHEIPDEDKAAYDRTGREGRPRTGWAALEGVETWDWKQYVRLLAEKNRLDDLTHESPS